MHTVTAGSQFDATSGKGLVDASADNVGLRVRVHGVYFRTSSSCTFTLKVQDPTTSANAPTLLTGSGTDAYMGDFFLPQKTDGNHWAIKFSTSGMTGDGYLTVDYSYERRSDG